MPTLADLDLIAFKGLLECVADAVRAAGPGGIPSGMVYATLSQVGIDFSTYDALIRAAVKAGLILKRGAGPGSLHLLISTEALREASETSSVDECGYCRGEAQRDCPWHGDPRED